LERKSGVLMHISSLFGDYSCGSFGNAAKYFIDFLYECGFSYWQVLPFCMTDEYNSPYKSYSAFSANPYFIDLEMLKQKELITNSELSQEKQKSCYLCEFDRLGKERLSLLKKAATRVKNKTEIEDYICKLNHISSFCKFMALKESNNNKQWQKWETDTIDKDTLFTWKFIQYEFYEQWKEIKNYANFKGIKIIGDIPMYVSLDSADVWSNRELFMLDKDGYPTHVAGVPPDYFSQNGQLWGNPLYNWSTMKNDGYKWWCERIKHISAFFDAVRIDHFRGIESFWAVPARAESAKDGKWIKGPGIALIKALKKAAGNTQIIAEDLGDITPQVRQLVNDSGFPGMRVFQFAFVSKNNSPHLPHNYPKNCIAYTGTHDNNTLLGYLWELDNATRERMLNYCGHKGDWKSGCESIIRTMLQSNAGLVIMPIQDLLGFGSDTRLNTPGRADGNWAYRITKEQLDSIDRESFKKLNKLYFR